VQDKARQSGKCQANGKCLVTKKTPNCDVNGGGKGCPKVKCPAITCPGDTEEAPEVNGCRGCPRCKGSCAADNDCKDDTYCGPAKQCIPYIKAGDPCPPAISAIVTKRCAKGTSCIAGVCKTCVPLPCPFLRCESEPTTQSNGCPGCGRCVTPP